MVRRRHGSDPDRTRTELEKLIQEQTVLKVSYKGSISYRNAAKVQRKSRKKSEFIPAAVGGGAEAAARERTKHDHPNNNGDSAHSFTDQEEGEEPEPSPDPRTPTPGTKLKPASSRSSGNGCLNCGATTGCAVGSGCKEEKASAPRDKGFEHQAAGGCPEPGVGHGTSAHGDGSRATPSRSDAVCGGMEPGPSGAESQNKTYTGSVGSLPQQQQRQPAPLKPKLRVGGGGIRPAGTHANSSDLGDRLVASVRRLSERSRRGGSAAAASSTAATRGHMKPLGLKEILGYLSSQEQLSEEKLTRGKVKVVMEREVARGRLRRTRCGNITLPLRGMVMAEEPASKKNAFADRLGKSALQEKHTPTKKVGNANLICPTRPTCTQLKCVGLMVTQRSCSRTRSAAPNICFFMLNLEAEVYDRAFVCVCVCVCMSAAVCVCLPVCVCVSVCVAWLPAQKVRVITSMCRQFRSGIPRLSRDKRARH